MKRRSLALLPTVFLLLFTIAAAADQPTVSGAGPDGDQTALPQQRVREVPDQIVRLENLVDATGVAPGVAAGNSPLLDARPGQIPFSFEKPAERGLVPASPYRGARPYQYNGMTFWWIPLSAAASGAELPAEASRPLKLLEPK